MTTATKDQITERVIAALVEIGEGELGEITPDSRFDQLDIDSLDLVELADVIELEYGLEISDDELDGIETIGDVVTFVSERQG
jgi:acyl carrier protein